MSLSSNETVEQKLNNMMLEKNFANKWIPRMLIFTICITVGISYLYINHHLPACIVALLIASAQILLVIIPNLFTKYVKLLETQDWSNKVKRLRVECH